MTNGRRLVLAFTFKLGQKQAQLRGAMETVKICSKCVGSTINAGSGFHCSSVLRLFYNFFKQKGQIQMIMAKCKNAATTLNTSALIPYSSTFE